MLSNVIRRELLSQKIRKLLCALKTQRSAVLKSSVPDVEVVLAVSYRFLLVHSQCVTHFRDTFIQYSNFRLGYWNRTLGVCFHTRRSVAADLRDMWLAQK